MTNKLTKIFDNIGFYFKVYNQLFVIEKSLKSYNTLNQNHVGYYIPYLCRNNKLGLVEIGIGEVQNDDQGNVVVARHQIVTSSNNNMSVNFPDTDNEFYIFANQKIFDTGISNVVVLDSDTHIQPVSATYLADCSDNTINIKLPSPQQSSNVIIECKNISPQNNLVIRDHKGGSLDILDSNKTYGKFVCGGDNWVSLLNDNKDSLVVQSTDGFSAQSSPTGDDFSLQYKEGSNFAGSSVYVDPTTNNVLLGADNAVDAYSILPTSGNQSAYINQQKYNSDFVVYGSGNRNLFFSYDGRLGLNIPSGSRPSTIFHVVNTICQEGFRLENRNACHPANITLYHKPSTPITNNTVVGQINLAGKNSDGNRVDYSIIESSAVNSSSSSIEGEIDIKIAVGSTGVSVFKSNNSATTVGYSGQNVSIHKTSGINLQNDSSSIRLGTNSVNISGSSVALQGSTINIGSVGSSISAPGPISSGPISAASIQSNNIVIPNIASGSLITTNGNNQLVGSSSIFVNNYGTLNLPISSNKLLQTTTSGAITGIYNTDDYFRTDGDILWNKYIKRSASACLRQITFDSAIPVEEYSAGDQLAIISGESTLYRRILSIDVNNNNITGLVVDQNVSLTDQSGLLVYSVTKGGYLSMQLSTEDGFISDSTKNVLSARTNVATEFNTLQKEIDFSVYGIDSIPAFKIKANTGKISVVSGLYRSFATNSSIPVFPIVVTTGGRGISSLYSSANCGYNPAENLFSGIVSDVGSNGLPSHYGTYDQNGNAAEWVEKPDMLETRDSTEFVAGGSYNIVATGAIGASGLKSVELLTRASGYDYVGFRVAGLYNMVDQSTISASSGLNMGFVGVIDPRNSEDTSTTYVKSGGSFSSIVINNLGVVDEFYRIGKYEVTNKQYCRFLNAVAKNNDRGLYDSRMSSENVGGINRIFDAEYTYTVKSNMHDKPVLFVNYLSAIRFINWMHNGASTTLDENDVDYNLDLGAYSIIPIGSDSYNIAKSSYRKYWLPSLNEWHKAAYFEPVETNSYTGTSTVMVKRDDPYLVASGIDTESKKFRELFANLSVSGWLYVDHLIVGDGTIRSSKRFTGIASSGDMSQSGQNNNTNNNPNLPSTSLDDIINNDPNAIESNVWTMSVGTSISGIPLRRSEDNVSSCVDPDLIANNNTPWFCDPNHTGPSLF